MADGKYFLSHLMLCVDEEVLFYDGKLPKHGRYSNSLLSKITIWLQFTVTY